jgi:hypothetical protein
LEKIGAEKVRKEKGREKQKSQQVGGTIGRTQMGGIPQRGATWRRFVRLGGAKHVLRPKWGDFSLQG